MAHMIKTKTLKKTVQSALWLCAFALSPFMAAGQAQAHDDRDYGYRDHPKYSHSHKHHNKHNNRGECRTVVQEFELSRHMTYTETGTACRDRYGAWQVVSPTRYPHMFGNVFLIEHGGMRLFLGQVSPRPNPHAAYPRDYGRDVRDYGYLDKKNHKKGTNYKFRH